MNEATRVLEGILFDLDGVIAETEDLHRQAYNLAFEEAGLDTRWSESDYRECLAMTAGSKLSKLETPSGVSDPTEFWERIYTRKRFHYLALLNSQSPPPRPGVVELIEEALEKGVKIGAASACAKEGALALLEGAVGAELGSRFTTLRAGDDVANRKPSPDIYLSALEGLGLEATSCVAIEDTRHGLQAAKAAGLWTLVTPSQYTRGDEYPGADDVVENLATAGVTLQFFEDRLRVSRQGSDPKYPPMATPVLKSKPTHFKSSEGFKPIPFPKFWSWQRQLSTRSWKRQIYRELVFRGIYLLGRLIFGLGLKRSARLAGSLGPLLFRFKRRDRIVVMENLERSLSDNYTAEELRTIAKNVFSNFALSAVETLWMSHWNELAEWLEIEVEGHEHLEAAVASKKGVICLNGHFGNWEAMSAWVCQEGYPGVIVARPIKDPRLDAWVRRARESVGIRVLDRGENPIRTLRALREGAVLGAMIDLDTRSARGTFVDFFGKPAYTQVGLFDLARKTGAALVPSLCYREGINRLRFVFGEPWEVARSEDPERDVIEATAKATRYLEDRIRERPEQWAWFHKRWKTRPERFNDPAGILKRDENRASKG